MDQSGRHRNSYVFPFFVFSSRARELGILRVSTRYNHAPDDDLVYMSRAAVFVYSGGGYSTLVAYQVSFNGGVVEAEQQQLIFQLLPLVGVRLWRAVLVATALVLLIAGLIAAFAWGARGAKTR